MTEPLTIQIDVPGEIVDAIREMEGVKHVVPRLKMWIERQLWEEQQFSKRWNIKPNGGRNFNQPPPPQQSTTPSYPRPQIRNRLEITGEDPGHLYQLQRSDRCVCGGAIPAGTEAILRVNAANERERWHLECWNKALERKRAEDPEF